VIIKDPDIFHIGEGALKVEKSANVLDLNANDKSF